MLCDRRLWRGKLNPPRGFTLIELLVVITVVGVLIAFLLPAVQAARDSARRFQCANNLRQVGIGLSNYHAQRKTLPPGYVSDISSAGAATGPGWGWMAHLLPFIEQQALANQIDYRLPIEAPANKVAREQLVPTLLCPSNEILRPTWPAEVRDAAGRPMSEICQVAFCAYMGNYGSTDTIDPGDGLFHRNSKIRFRDMTDGASKTFAAGEKAYKLGDGTWTGAVTGASMYPDKYDKKVAAPHLKPATAMVLSHVGLGNTPNNSYSEINQFWSLHGSGANFVFADGHVAFLPTTIDYRVYKSMATRAGGEAGGGAY
jgi:prepilin-type N-terminal cleavage/methylation domain-containing protein/prepilin-type processing-associated H-X9-DG protein